MTTESATKTKRRRYDDEFRRAAVLAGRTEGCKPAARRLGIPTCTLRQWVYGRRQAHTLTYLEQHAGQLADAFEQTAWECLALAGDKIADAPLNHLVAAAGLSADKMRLLRGQPTAVNANLNAAVPGIDLSRLTPDERGALRELLARASAPRPIEVNATDDGEEEEPNPFAGTILDSARA